MVEEELIEAQNPLPWLVDRVVGTSYCDLPSNAVEKAKTFTIDSFGVGVAGCKGFALDQVLRVAQSWGLGDEATMWTSGQRLPASAAAFLNGYQIHALEFDCVNEDAVLHPFATVLSAVMAYCERRSAQGRPVNGRDFLTAICMAVDVSIFLGKASTGPIRFFRPAAAGGFGAVAGIGKLEGFNAEAMTGAIGIHYGQASGTMQAHVEGSPLLGLQVGFNSRAAVISCDFAAKGLFGPKDVLTGPHGYFRLFENGDFDVEHGKRELEKNFQIERMSHKPFPSGRLSHGAVDGLMRLTRAHGFGADEIDSITCVVPQLVYRLMGRPDVPDPAPNYAKLCLPFVIGTYLVHGAVDVEHFIGDEMLQNRRTHDIAKRVTLIQNDNPSHSAMTPQTINVRLKSGVEHSVVVEAAYGHPDNPLSHQENLDKFWRCWNRAGDLDETAGRALIEAVDNIEDLADVAVLTRHLVASKVD